MTLSLHTCATILAHKLDSHSYLLGCTARHTVQHSTTHSTTATPCAAWRGTILFCFVMDSHAAARSWEANPNPRFSLSFPVAHHPYHPRLNPHCVENCTPCLSRSVLAAPRVLGSRTTRMQTSTRTPAPMAGPAPCSSTQVTCAGSRTVEEKAQHLPPRPLLRRTRHVLRTGVCAVTAVTSAPSAGTATSMLARSRLVVRHGVTVCSVLQVPILPGL